MNPSCDQCGGWVESSNRGWPGYCSRGCRDVADLVAHEVREQIRSRRAAMRARHGSRAHNAVEIVQ